MQLYYIAKTKVMRVSRDPTPRNLQLTIKGEPVENVDSFVYLESLLTSDNDCSKSIKRRLGLSGASFKNLLKDLFKNLFLKTPASRTSCQSGKTRLCQLL